MENSVEIFGTKGRISLPNPWVSDRVDPDPGSIILTIRGQGPRTIDVPADRTSYAYEAERVARAVAAGDTEGAWPAMSWGDSLGNLSVLDAWRQAVGLTYDLETERMKLSADNFRCWDSPDNRARARSTKPQPFCRP